MKRQIAIQNGKKMNFAIIIVFICLFIILGIELFYLFTLSSQEALSKKKEKSLPINILRLAGWVDKREFSGNISYENGTLTLANITGVGTKGNLLYINRKNAIPIINDFIIELKFLKKMGESVAVNLISPNEFDSNDIDLENKGIEISLSNDNDIHIISFNNEKKIQEIFYIGKMPSSNFIRIKIINNFISIQDEEEKDIGTIFFTYNPFEEKKELFIGLKAGPNSIIEVSQFFIYTKQESP